MRQSIPHYFDDLFVMRNGGVLSRQAMIYPVHFYEGGCYLPCFSDNAQCQYCFAYRNIQFAVFVNKIFFTNNHVLFCLCSTFIMEISPCTRLLSKSSCLILLSYLNIYTVLAAFQIRQTLTYVLSALADRLRSRQRSLPHSPGDCDITPGPASCAGVKFLVRQTHPEEKLVSKFTPFSRIKFTSRIDNCVPEHSF